MINVFILTYNEEELFNHIYNHDLVAHLKRNQINFIVLDNGKQDGIKTWCEQHDFPYYRSEFNIGSSGGYNWIFKVAHAMGINEAILMQADVHITTHYPLTLTYNLTKEKGSTHFMCWPQQMYGFWDIKEPLRIFDDNLHNLGNLVGFNPRAMRHKNCYFDENFVVTHYDDLEFIHYIKNMNLMQIYNVPFNQGFHNQKYLTNYEIQYANKSFKNNIFRIEAPEFEFSVYHASTQIPHVNTHDHSFWLDFNKEHMELFWKNNGRRTIPYDPSRWTRFEYPPYPVYYEMLRFFKQFPDFLKNNHWIEVAKRTCES